MSANRWASAWRRTTWWPFGASAVLAAWLAWGPAPAAGPASPAQRAWHQAETYLSAGRTEEARRLYRYVLRTAGPGEAALVGRARLALEYRLPVEEARRRLGRGDGAGALEVLAGIPAAHAAHPERGPYLEALRRQARAAARRGPGREGEARVLAALRARLEAYRRRHGRFPPDVEALNRLLPADRPPLEAHDIVGYRHGPWGYRLVLRRKGAAGGFVTLYGTAPLR